MEDVNRTKLHILNKIIHKAKNFLYSDLFLIAIAFITIFVHTFNLSIFGIGLFVFIVCFVLLSGKDTTPIIPVAFFVVFMIKDYAITLMPIFYIILSPVVICFVAHIIIYPSKNFSRGKMFFPLIAVSIALLLGGIFPAEYRVTYLNGLLEIIAFGPLILFVYLFFRNNIEIDKNFNLERYFILSIVLSGIIAMLEFWNGQIIYGFGYSTKIYSFFGWGNPNVVSNILVTVIPLLCYLLSKSKTIVPFLIVLVLVYASILLCSSDACKVISIIMFIPSVVYLYLSLPIKKRFILSTFILIVFCSSLLLIFFVKPNLLIEIFELIKNANDTGRTKLYNDAINCFKNSPLFGAGMGYSPKVDSFTVGNITFYNFHSTIFQVVGKMGLVGIIAYAYLFYMRYKILLNNHSKYNVFMTLSFSFTMTYAFIDTAEFNILPFGIMFIFIILITEILNEKREEKLPLFYFSIN